MKNIKSHDLNLSAWGPYTKKYIGISHIPEIEKGKRFDLSIFPGLHRRGLSVPNVLWESNYHPWEASSDLRYFSNRHQLLWKDRIYSDISYSIASENEVMFSCRNRNNTEETQAFVFHHAASLHFPAKKAYSTEKLIPSVLSDAGEFALLDGLDYDKLIFRESSPQRNLAYDGIIWGEVRDSGFTGGAGLGGGFGESTEDKAVYSLPPSIREKGKIYLRCRIPSGETRTIGLAGAIEAELHLTGSGDFQTVPVGDMNGGDETITLDPAGSGAVDIDCLIFSKRNTSGDPVFTADFSDPKPEIHEGPIQNSVILKYSGVDQYYGIAWETDGVVREFLTDDLDCLMRFNVHEHNDRFFKGTGEGHYTDIFTRPLYVPPRSETTVYGKICCGTREQVESALSRFSPADSRNEEICKNFREKRVRFDNSDPYAFSMERMAATALTNVVYPVRTQGSWVRHHSPGRWWDSLYTWDSGFIGLGFAALDRERAEDNLNAYLTLPGNSHAAFIHHGSPVPTQFYLYQEIFNRTGSREFLRKYYRQLLQYHRFMTGRLGSSTIGKLKSGLLKTWDYFYSAGGWDDYPPQVYIRNNGLEETVTPVITTAMGIRTASILIGAAVILGEGTDELEEDRRRLTEALQNHSWDDEAGYFSAVCHNEKGEADHFLREPGGENFNRGFDGIYPLNAGICSESQRKLFTERMFSIDRLWTDIGLTAVDQSAPYYRDDGYWNGTVWLSHQWVFWKTMLDLGEGDKAFRIAETALNLWKRQVEEHYLCFEHFITTTGQGAGWHHFGGLSSPVLNWHSAYHETGTVTGGHDMWVESRDYDGEKGTLEASIRFVSQSSPVRTIIAVMKGESSDWDCFWNGEPVSIAWRPGGILELNVRPDCGRLNTLEIRRKNQ